MGKIKILYLIDVFYEFAGAERNLYEIVKNIDKEKFVPFVFALKGGERLSDIESLGMKTGSLNIKRVYGIQGVKKIFELIRIIKKEKIDIIVSYHMGADILAVISGKMAGAKVLISSRRDMGYKLKKRHVLIYRIINRYFNKIITVSDAVSKVITQREKVEKDQLLTIYNGINFERIKDEKYIEQELKEMNISKVNYYVGMMATFRKVKGVEYFIKAAGIISKTRKDVRFLVVGKPQVVTDRIKGRVKELEQLVNSSPDYNNVTFIEFKRDISKMINFMDIIALPSLSEGFSNILIEAMASCKPVVASKVGGNIEAVIEGETGYLVPPADEKALAEAILKLIENDELRRKMGIAAKKVALQKFSLDKMMADIQALYLYLYQEQVSRREKRENYNNVIIRLSKNFIASLLYYSGAIDLYMAIKKLKGSILILTYHNITEKTKDYLNIDLSFQTLTMQLAVINKYFRIVSIKEIVELISAGKSKGNFMAITFDDGYKGVYQYANQQYLNGGLPFCVFLSSQCLEKENLLWFDKLIYSIDTAKTNILNIEEFNLGIYLLNSEKAKIKTCEKLANKLKVLSSQEREKVIDNLISKLGVTEMPPAARIYITKEEVKELIERDVTIGSHSVTHLILSRISDRELEFEMRHSKNYLEETFNVQVDYFAYPNGKKSDFNEDTISSAIAAGYKNAFTLIPEKLGNPYQIGRLGIYEVSNFNKAVFALKLAMNLRKPRRGCNCNAR